MIFKQEKIKEGDTIQIGGASAYTGWIGTVESLKEDGSFHLKCETRTLVVNKTTTLLKLDSDCLWKKIKHKVKL